MFCADIQCTLSSQYFKFTHNNYKKLYSIFSMRRFKMHVAEKHPDISEEDNCKIASLNKVKMHKVQGKLGKL